MPTAPFPPAPPPAPPPDVRGALRKGLATVSIGLAAAGVAWWWTDGLHGLFVPAPSRIAPYTLSLDAGVPADAEIAFYRKRITKNPDGFMERNLLAAAYLRKAREAADPTFLELARREAEASSRLQADGNVDAERIAIELLMADHRFPEARRRLEKLAKGAPAGTLEPLFASLDLAQGRPADAVRRYEAIVRRHPTTAAFGQLGLARAAAGQDQAAEAAFQEALEREQSGERLISADVRTWLGRLWLNRGRAREAVDLFNEALRIYPRHPQALGLAGDAAARLGDLAAADERWRQAGEIRHDAGPELARARIAVAAGRREDAEAHWAAAEAKLRGELQAGRVDHRRDLARLLLERGRPADVPETRQLLAAERQVREDAETLDLAAWAALEAGDATGAAELAAKLAATGAREARYALRQAMVARARQDLAAAEAAAKEAEAIDPTWAQDPASLATVADDAR